MCDKYTAHIDNLGSLLLDLINVINHCMYHYMYKVIALLYSDKLHCHGIHIIRHYTT